MAARVLRGEAGGHGSWRSVEKAADPRVLIPLQSGPAPPQRLYEMSSLVWCVTLTRGVPGLDFARAQACLRRETAVWWESRRCTQGNKAAVKGIKSQRLKRNVSLLKSWSLAVVGRWVMGRMPLYDTANADKVTRAREEKSPFYRFADKTGPQFTTRQIKWQPLFPVKAYAQDPDRSRAQAHPRNTAVIVSALAARRDTVAKIL